MKKILACLLVLGMLASPMACCKRVDDQGVTTSNALNCLKTSQDIVCNAPQGVMDVIGVVAPLIASYVFPSIDPALVKAAVTGIQQGGCVTLTQLNALIAWITAFNNQQQAAALKGLYKAPKSIPVDPLIIWGYGS